MKEYDTAARGITAERGRTHARDRMASFGKLTDYFNRRRSRDELMARRDGRRSGSYCCTVAEARYSKIRARFESVYSSGVCVLCVHGCVCVLLPEISDFYFEDDGCDWLKL